MREKWVEAPKITGNEELARKFSVSPMAMRLIRSRAGESEAEVREYLCGTIEELADPYLMKGMREAVSLLREKIREGASIRIIGDYDIDGVNATHILITALRRCGAQADTVIPDRMKDGYGINEHLIGDAKKAGVDTIVTCDNGIAAAKEIAFAKELGMTVIVTDHHDIPYQEEADGSRTVILPPADVIVNPKQPDCRYPFKKLCGAAVAWRLAEALYRGGRSSPGGVSGSGGICGSGHSGRYHGPDRGEPDSGEIWPEAAGADKKSRIPGASGCERSGRKKADCLSHRIRHRALHVNASGRLDTARRALQLLGAETKAEAEELAGDLKALNDSRKDLTVKGTQQAVQMIEETDLKQDRVLVVYLPDCHESLGGNHCRAYPGKNISGPVLY